MRIRTLAQRIVNQLRHDKRTMALVIFAPLIVLTLVYFILGDTNTSYKVIAGTAPNAVIEQLEDNEDINIVVIDDEGNEWDAEGEDKDTGSQKPQAENLKEAVKKQGATAAINVSDDLEDVNIYIDATNSANAQKVEAAVRSALSKILQDEQKTILENLRKMSAGSISGAGSASSIGSASGTGANIGTGTVNDASKVGPEIIEPDIETDYVYGSEGSTFFDNYGAALIGIIVFFFTFLIAGINFLGERKSGTLEKMLSTPIRRHEIVFGYVLGFSVLALIQTVVVTLFVVYVLGLTVVGSMWYVIVLNLLTAITALTLGILLSTLANSEFQMVQFIPLVIIPQIFLCGLFELSSGWEIVGRFMPLYYSADGLTEVIIRGSGITEIWLDVLVLFAFSLVFMVVNILLLKKQRSV